jgi:hypothetical protein
MNKRTYLRKEIIDVLTRLSEVDGITFDDVTQFMVEETGRMVGVVRTVSGDNRADAFQSLFIACAHDSAASSQKLRDSAKSWSDGGAAYVYI